MKHEYELTKNCCKYDECCEFPQTHKYYEEESFKKVTLGEVSEMMTLTYSLMNSKSDWNKL